SVQRAPRVRTSPASVDHGAQCVAMMAQAGGLGATIARRPEPACSRCSGRSATLAAMPGRPPREAQETRGRLARLRLVPLLRRFPQRPVWGAFMLVNGFVTIALLAGLAMVTRTPFVFP